MAKKKGIIKQTSETDRNKLKKQALIKSISSASTITDACEAADCSRDSYYTWYHEDKKFKKAIDTAKKSQIQAVENALFKSATDGNITAQIFFLCNRARQDWESVNKVEHRGGIEVNLKSEMEKINKNLDGRRKGHRDGLSKRSK